MHEELKDRIDTILKEKDLKQVEFAKAIGVSKSYISSILAGRKNNISYPYAKLIETEFGYSADWVLRGSLPKLKINSQDFCEYDSENLSAEHRQAISQIQKLSPDKAKAVLAFVQSLERFNFIL